MTQSKGSYEEASQELQRASLFLANDFRRYLQMHKVYVFYNAYNILYLCANFHTSCPWCRPNACMAMVIRGSKNMARCDYLLVVMLSRIQLWCIASILKASPAWDQPNTWPPLPRVSPNFPRYARGTYCTGKQLALFASQPWSPTHQLMASRQARLSTSAHTWCSPSSVFDRALCHLALVASKSHLQCSSGPCPIHSPLWAV